MQTKRMTFPRGWLPYALLAPQVIITLIFFIWPSIQALYTSVLREDAFGTRREYVGMENFSRLFNDPLYLNSMGVTAIFAIGTTLLSMSLALLFAAKVNDMLRSRDSYTTLMVWPYAVAPAVAGVLWWFMFNPSIGIVTYMLEMVGYDWNHRRSGSDAMILIIIAAAWKQIAYNFIFFLAGMQSIPNSLIEAAAIDGASRAKRFWTVVFPLLTPITFFLMVAALFVIMFIYGWNQYLWPLLITTDPDYYTIVMGIQRMVTGGDSEPLWHLVMATVVLAALPPVLVILFMQRLFVKGLTETEK